MTIVLHAEHLTTLGLRINDIQGLPEEERAKEVKKAWRKKCLETHPDKHSAEDKSIYEAQFKAVNDAYTALTTTHNDEDLSGYDINQFFSPSKIFFPDTTFDIPMQEGIYQAFAVLRKKFAELDSDDKKRQFAHHYSSFLSLAQELERRQSKINVARGDALVHQEIEAGIGEFLEREWRMLLIRLFAEEYLDDFQYRHALAFGDLLSILAIRKIISPLKWIAAIVGGLDLLFRGSAEYCLKHEQSGLANVLFIIGSPVSVVNFFVALIASPINNVIRPLAEATGLPSSVLAILLASVSAGLIHELASGSFSFTLASALLLLPYVTVALNLYSIYVVYQLAQNFKNAGIDAEELIWFFSLLILLNFIPYVPISDFFVVVFDLCLFTAFEKITAEKPIEFLPLPAEHIPEEVKVATLLGYNKANQSHRFFGTPKDACAQKDRTFWQKTAGFFGVDSASVDELAPQFEDALGPYALEYEPMPH